MTAGIRVAYKLLPINLIVFFALVFGGSATSDIGWVVMVGGTMERYW